MIVVLIAGGSGTRLWPLSTPETPKHLLKLIDDESLLQSSFKRSKALTSIDKIYVITSPKQIDAIRKELPELPPEAFITEPDVRGTGNCLIAGLHYIKKRGHDLDEPIAFNAADHYVRDIRGYVNSFRITEKACRKYNKVALVGVEPTYPTTGLGYIHKGDAIEDDALVYEVLEFKEKPELELAKKYVSSGDYVWNCNYYCGSVNAFKKVINKYSPVLKEHYEALQATKNDEAYRTTYLAFNEAITDYELSEKVPPKTFLIVPASFDWMDVGLFGDLHDAVEKDGDDNYIRGDNIVTMDVENSYIRNENPSLDMIVIGLDNVVVVNTPKGLLVARKDLAPKVKEALQVIKNKEPSK